MFILANEDMGKVKTVICEVISTLNDGARKVEKEVDIRDGLKPIVVMGYWAADIIRIDVKIRKS